MQSFILVLFVFICHVRNHVFLLTLLQILPMCSFHYRCELIVQPRCLADETICRMYLLRVFSVMVITLHLSRQVSLVEQELLTRVHPRFLLGFVLLDLQFYMYVLQIVVYPFVLFLLTIVLSVLLRYTDSNYPFGIFKLFLSR